MYATLIFNSQKKLVSAELVESTCSADGFRSLCRQLARTPNLGNAPRCVVVPATAGDSLAIIRHRGEVAIARGHFTEQIDPTWVRLLGVDRAAELLTERAAAASAKARCEPRVATLYHPTTRRAFAAAAAL